MLKTKATKNTSKKYSYQCCKFVLFICLLMISNFLYAQQPQTINQPGADTLRRIEIIGAESMRQFTDASGEVLQTLAGNARLKQGSTLLSGDSIIINLRTGVAEGFGNIHINDADTLNTYSQYLKYIGNERVAYLKKAVKLTDGKGTLLTEDLVYNLETGIGTYNNGGKVLNGNTVLTSKSAVYYSQTKDVYFKENVNLTDPKYKINSDSLQYNTEFKIATFIAPTKIVSDNGIVNTRSGTYNLQTGEAFFSGNPEFSDSTRSVRGRNIAVDEKTGIINIEGNGKIVDSVNKVILLGDMIFLDKKKNTFLGTRKPVMIFYSDNDSTYITADTLFSGMKNRDSSDIVSKQLNDSTGLISIQQKSDSIRFFLGFRNVKIFNDSAQAVADSMYYSSKDSVFRLYKDPLFWNGKTQVQGDTMYLFTLNKKPERVEVFYNSFVINKPEEGIFNQISGRTLNVFFKDGDIDHIRVKGSPAESIYYPQDSDSAYIGMNRAKGDVIEIEFIKKELEKIKFINEVNGTLYPISQTPSNLKYLKGFIWQDKRRPKSKLDLFE